MSWLMTRMWTPPGRPVQGGTERAGQARGRAGNVLREGGESASLNMAILRV